MWKPPSEEELQKSYEEWDANVARSDNEVALERARDQVQRSANETVDSLKNQINQYESSIGNLKTLQKSGDKTETTQKTITNLGKEIELRQSILTELNENMPKLTAAVNAHVSRPKKGATKVSTDFQQSKEEIHYQSKVQTLVGIAQHLAHPKNEAQIKHDIEGPQKGIEKGRGATTQKLADQVLKHVGQQVNAEPAVKVAMSGRDRVNDVMEAMKKKVSPTGSPEAGPSSKTPSPRSPGKI